MKLTLIGNGIMAQSLARGLIKNHEVEIIGRDIDKLKNIQEKMPQIKIKVLEDHEDITNKNVLFCVKPYALQSVSARLTGNANILLHRGIQCDDEAKQVCSELETKRVYAGATFETTLPYGNKPITYHIQFGTNNEEKVFN